MWWRYFDIPNVPNEIREGLWKEGRPAWSSWNVEWRPGAINILFQSFCVAVLITFIRHFLVKYVIYPWAYPRVIKAGYKEVHVTKFCESSCRFIFYTISSISIITTALKKPYFWEPWRQFHIDDDIGMDEWVIYIVELGYYSHGMFSHIFLEKRKSDFLVMLIHHLATFFLLFASLFVGFFKIGFLVLVAHDICDPFLEAGKMFNYLHAFWPGVISFFGLIITWICARLIFFPLHCVLACWLEGGKLMGNDAPFYIACCWGLTILQVLHIYWFFLIVKTGFKICRGDIHKQIDIDAREVDEEHNDESTSNKKNTRPDSNDQSSTDNKNKQLVNNELNENEKKKKK